MSRQLKLKHAWETRNYHRYEAVLSNGETWHIYVPKGIGAPEITTYIGREPTRTMEDSLPPDPECGCKGAHYHAPIRRRATTKKAKR